MSSVTIIGAGPVGLFAALLLAQSGIPITIVEVGDDIDSSPRACVWFPPVNEELRKAGILQDVIDAGEKEIDGVDWRSADGKVIAGIDPPPPSDDPEDVGFVVALGQSEFGKIVVEKLKQFNNVEILIGHSFERLAQDGNSVTYWLRNVSSGAETERKCTYLVGADGGRSSVRRSLGIELEGFTWENLQFIAINFRYPLQKLGWKAANFIIDPVDWAIVPKLGNGDQWRMATGVRKDAGDRMTVIDEETAELVKDRVRRLLPGDTSKVIFDRMAPYVVRNGCASRFREGNVLLIGDAAHLNSPVDALGMSTGILDAAHIAQTLRSILLEGGSTRLLDTFAEARRQVFLERTEPMNQANTYRMFSQEPEHVEERERQFAGLNNPRDFVTMSKMGLQTFGLTTTSDKFYDTHQEIVWFISASKIPEWTSEKFEHEYKVVHSSMTKKLADMGAPIRRYVQLKNNGVDESAFDRPEWDYVTCLTFPSLFINYMGFQEPGYKANAGSHVFCRLDQQGALMTQVKRIGDGYVGKVRALVYHRRSDPEDEVSMKWLEERGKDIDKLVSNDRRAKGYTLWRDATPKNTKRYFKDTLFIGGSWHEFKAIEAFDFEDEKSGGAFLQEHVERLGTQDGRRPLVVLGDADVVV